MRILKTTILTLAVASALSLSPLAAAQEYDPERGQGPWPTCPHPLLFDMIEQLVKSGPTKNETVVWATPTASQSEALTNGIDSMIIGLNNLAQQHLTAAGMAGCWGRSKSSSPTLDVAIVYDPDGLSKSTSVGLPFLIVNRSATVSGDTSRVILSIPHTRSEVNLDKELIPDAITDANDPAGKRVIRAAVVSTVHRCHHTTELTDSRYNGDTDTDGCNGRIRISDDAHNPDSLFQTMHAALRENHMNDQVVQLHSSGSNFPGISISNSSGDQYNGTEDDSDHAVVAWYRELHTNFNLTSNMTICHAYTLASGESRNADYFQISNRKCGTRNATYGEDPRRPMDDAFSSDPDVRRRHFLHFEINSDLKNSTSGLTNIVSSLPAIVE